VRTFEVEHEYALSPRELVGVVLDEDFLAARAREFGGSDPPTVHRDGDHVRVSGPRRIPVEHAPGLAKRLLPPDGLAEQTDRWDLTDADRPTAQWFVVVAGAPADLTGDYRIESTATGSRYQVTGRVAVRVPLLGGSLEGMVVDNVRDLVSAELRFLADWLARR
jgi:hypothetical protein